MRKLPLRTAPVLPPRMPEELACMKLWGIVGLAPGPWLGALTTLSEAAVITLKVKAIGYRVIPAGSSATRSRPAEMDALSPAKAVG